MRKIISYFIKYHVSVNVLILAVVAFGFIGASKIKSSFFPLLDSENIGITIVYPGASPEEIEEGIILKIEDNLKGLEGIDRVTSVASENSGAITVELKRGEDIYVRLNEVKDAVEQVPNFPTGMEPLTVTELKRTNSAITFGLTGDDIPIATLKTIGRTIENDLRAVDGISQIEISGYPDEEIEIALNESDLLAFDLTFNDVANAVRNANIIVTGGNIKTNEEDYLIRAQNRVYFADELSSIIIKSTSDGRIVTLEDIAILRDRFSETPNASYFNGKRAITFNIVTTNTEDLIFAADQAKAYIENFNQRNDKAHLDILRDRSQYVKERSDLLVSNAIMGIILVLIFLSLFLNTRLAFWVALGLPISFLGLFIFAPSMGITINVLSLFGLIVVIGILVDDGIVIAENIYNHYEKGKSAINAAIDGTLEVIPPILSAITTTILAFSIFGFLDSDIGQFFSQVSSIVIVTLLVSLVEALIILPAHIAHSKALKRREQGVEIEKRKTVINRIFSKLRGINRSAEKLLNYVRDNAYSPLLRFTLANRFFSLSIIVVFFMLTIAAIQGGVIGVTIFPSIASTQVSVSLTLPEGTNERYADSIISMIEEKAWVVNDELSAQQDFDVPVVESIIKTIGPGTAQASLQVNLSREEERDFPSRDISNRLRELVGEVYGVENLSFDGGSNFGGTPISISLLGNNIDELKAAKVDLKNELEKIDLLKDISDSDPAGIKEIRLELKEKAYFLGLTLNEVMSQVRSGFFGNQVQRLQRGEDEIKVWVRYDRPNRASINDLDDMRISTPGGQKVPLQEIASYNISRGDVSINRLDGAREIQVNSDIKNNNETSSVLDQIKTEIVPSILSRYPTVRAQYEGQNREAEKLSSSFADIAPIMLILIYMTIAFTFRSYSQPILLLIMIPFTVIGVAWGHFIHGFPLNFLSLLGIIALIGITVNDGLVLISKLNTFLKEGMPFDEAVFEAGRSRFRAIVLTSATTIAGLAPLILEKSRNAQFLIPMAISVAYGIAIATVLTLLMLPILVSLTNDAKVKIKWLFTGKNVEKRAVERAVIELETEYEEFKK